MDGTLGTSISRFVISTIYDVHELYHIFAWLYYIPSLRILEKEMKNFNQIIKSQVYMDAVVIYN